MARAKSTRKGKKSGGGPSLTPAQIEVALGVGFIGLALATFFSLVSSRGALTGAWIDFLRWLMGWGFVFSPVWLGAIGVFLIVDTFDQKPDIRWDQVWGVALVFAAMLGLVHLGESFVTGVTAAQLVEEGRGGGYLGLVIGKGLADALGAIGAVLLLLMFLFIGMVLAAREQIAGLMHWVGATSAELADSWRRARLPINPSPGANGPLFDDPDDIPIRAAGRAIEVPPLAPPPVMEPEEPPLKPPTIIGSPEPRPEPIARSMPAERADLQPAPALRPTNQVVPRVLGSNRAYQLPSVGDILEDNVEQEVSRDEIRQKARTIEDTLNSFGVPARVIEVNQGPAITQFGVEPLYIEKKDAKGQVTRSKVKVNKISTLANDLALALAAPTIRIEAPVPGRAMVGIEVPNTKAHVVSLRGVIETEQFRAVSQEGRLGLALGQDVSGQAVAVDLVRMPHLLIAGATGAGKSVCINAIIASLLLTHTPSTLRFLMVDPKRVELVQYNEIPHLLANVVVDMDQVVQVLELGVREMERRYKLFAKVGARNIESYNQIMTEKGEPKLHYLVMIVDELADLMMVAPDEVERLVCRLAQMARATGIHLILATQRPSVDVVTGLIKANFPARIAFAVTSQVDSRVILDTQGAEKLLGRGDMLYMAPDASKLQRLQGCYVSDRELDRLVRYWKGMGPRIGETRPTTGLPTSLADEDQTAIPTPQAWPPVPPNATSRGRAAGPTPTAQQPSLLPEDLDFGGSVEKGPESGDELWEPALEVVRGAKTASASLLQRKLRIGYQRASRLIDEMERAGILGPPEGPTKARAVLVKDETDDEDVEEW